jgi:3-hydroxy-9,10-secoandrosta-1,3,5(10)-triene-9,17-dione monooxygenase
LRNTDTALSASHPLVSRARELVPVLRNHAADTELVGDIAPRSVAALRAAGMFSLFVPESFTHRKVGLADAVQAFVELGRGCGSSAWVAMILSAGCAMVSLLDDDVRAEVWSDDPSATVASVTSMTGTGDRIPGGWLVSGRWQPASGIRHAQWALLGTLVRQDDDIDPVLVLVPVEELRIVPTWSVAGMQGTGSETVVAEEVFVPDGRTLSGSQAVSGGYSYRHLDEPFAAIPLGPLLAGMVVGPIIGMAEAAVDSAVEQLRASGRIAGSRQEHTIESPGAEMAVASAVSLVDSARLHGFRAVRDLEVAMRDRAQLDAHVSARIRMDAGVVSVTVRRAVGELLDVCGPRAFATGNSLHLARRRSRMPASTADRRQQPRDIRQCGPGRRGNSRVNIRHRSSAESRLSENEFCERFKLARPVLPAARIASQKRPLTRRWYVSVQNLRSWALFIRECGSDV